MKNIIIHYSEIALKGKNRPIFETCLVDNIKKLLPAEHISDIKRLSGRILLKLKDGFLEKELNKTIGLLSNIFGISHYSPAVEVNSDIKEIEKAGVEVMGGIKSGTFKVETKRAYKQFSFNSLEISSMVGSAIFKKTKIKVDVKNPDITVFVEVLKNQTYIYSKKIKGLGGLPVGVSGKSLVLISGGIDSPVASYLMMKRGCELEFIHFHSYPYTNKASIEKVTDLLKVLQKYQKKFKLYLVPIIEFQKEVVKEVEDKYRIILYRRLMYKVAEQIAKNNNIKALVSGDNLGQVASQTIENMGVIGNGLELPILRPLLTYDKSEIIELAEKIGTMELSTEPHDDCCSIFLPKNPITKSRIGNILTQEEMVQMKKWVDKIMKNYEIKDII